MPNDSQRAASSPLLEGRRERVLTLVKALPHVGQKHGETVCCAGLTAEGQWRRQYPIHFRRLKAEFGRWDWIEYDWRAPGGEDRRAESRRVQETTLCKVDTLSPAKRAAFLDRAILPSCEAAAAKGHSLTLIRPRNTRFWWKKKPDKQVAREKAAYERAAQQLSFLDPVLMALNPCPYEFKFNYDTEDGFSHRATCDDWETAAMFYRFAKERGSGPALADMEQVFNEEYPAKGMVFAMGTHSLYPKVWLLVGVVRLDVAPQRSLLL